MMKYLEGEAFTDEEIEAAAPQGHARGIGGSGLRRLGAPKNIGVRELIDDDRQARPLAGRGRLAHGHGRRDADRARSRSGPFVAQVFKTTADPFVGRLTYFRVVSRHASAARATSGTSTDEEEERVGNLLGRPGQGPVEPARQVGPGDIAAVAKLT